MFRVFVNEYTKHTLLDHPSGSGAGGSRRGLVTSHMEQLHLRAVHLFNNIMDQVIQLTMLNNCSNNPPTTTTTYCFPHLTHPPTRLVEPRTGAALQHALRFL